MICPKFSLTIVCLILLAAGTVSFAVEHDCGTVLTEEQYQNELLRNSDFQKYKENTAFRDDLHYSIPIAVHIVRSSQGEGGLDTALLQDIFDTSNALNEPLNVSFYMYSLDFIDDDYYFYGTDNYTAYNDLREENVQASAVNVYFVPDSSGFPYCGLSSYSGSIVQGIIMNNVCADPFNYKSTFPHEVGHYFDLYHTHEDFFGVECPDGSNGETAGDLISDTPADPDLYQHVSDYPACEYDNYAPPPIECDATPYNPDVSNIMSYSRKLCRDVFSAGQAVKYRYTLENIRTELAYAFGGLITSGGIDLGSITLGQVGLDTLRLNYVGQDSIELTSASLLGTGFNLSGSWPALLHYGDSTQIEISYDTGSGDICDYGVHSDSLILTFSFADYSQLSFPVDLTVGIQPPSQDYYTLGQSCLELYVPNTPQFGYEYQLLGMNVNGRNMLFSGTRLLGLVDGSDTIVYQQIYLQDEYIVVDSLTERQDSLGRENYSLEFATSDSRLHGTVNYALGTGGIGLEDCQYIQVDYTIRNPCDTALTLYAGMFGDFEIDQSGEDYGYVDNAEKHLIYQRGRYENITCALGGLYACGENKGMKAVNYIDEIYPYANFRDYRAYEALAFGQYFSATQYTNASLLLSFGEATIQPDDSLFCRAAIIYADSSLASYEAVYDELKAVLSTTAADIDGDCFENDVDNCPNKYNPDQLDTNENGIGDICEYICGDANDDEVVDISDAVFIINYAFAGGQAPDPIESGDCNCDASVDISDAVYVINYAFSGGSAPCDPNGDGIPDC